jgi:hypothetical protein
VVHRAVCILDERLPIEPVIRINTDTVCSPQ